MHQWFYISKCSIKALAVSTENRSTIARHISGINTSTGQPKLLMTVELHESCWDSCVLQECPSPADPSGPVFFQAVLACAVVPKMMSPPRKLFELPASKLALAVADMSWRPQSAYWASSYICSLWGNRTTPHVCQPPCSSA